MERKLKLGSLFDGSGGFPLAGALFGIEPVWASEIEPYPIRVTTVRFPGMKHLGDITKINGAEIEPVDIITFGSPCQDLSIAGKQAGIHEGERSNLFFEAIRIIREMRGVSANQYPRFAVWENVPGAFSSNKGNDFRTVLQAFCDAAGQNVSVPESPRGGWKPSGCIVGSGFSLAWRLYDAQFWGVPQRRKRVYLIADFGSECAGEILFKSEGLQWDSAESRKAEQNVAGYVEGCPDGSGWFKWMTVCYEKPDEEVCCYDARGNGGGGWTSTLTGDHENRVTDYTSIVCYTAKRYAEYTEGLPTLRASGADIGGGSEGLILLGDREQSDRRKDKGHREHCTDNNGKNNERLL